jgi:hypothetical protein
MAAFQVRANPCDYQDDLIPEQLICGPEIGVWSYLLSAQMQVSLVGGHVFTGAAD